MLSQSIPAICIDVDGVLKRGPVPIPGAISAIKKLRKFKIPFSILTNGGGETEQVRAKSLSKLLQLSESEKLKPDEVVLCHSPMKDVLKKYKNGTMLICGAGKIKEVKYRTSASGITTAQIIAKGGEDIREELCLAFSHADVPMLTLNQSKTTLEEIFLELTQGSGNRMIKEEK